MSWVFLHNPCSPPGLSPLLCRLERLYLESAVQSTTLGGLGQNVPGPRLHAENKMGEWALLLSLLKRILPLLGPYSLKSHSSCNEELIQELALPFFANTVHAVKQQKLSEERSSQLLVNYCSFPSLPLEPSCHFATYLPFHSEQKQTLSQARY